MCVYKLRRYTRIVVASKSIHRCIYYILKGAPLVHNNTVVTHSIIVWFMYYMAAKKLIIRGMLAGLAKA